MENQTGDAKLTIRIKRDIARLQADIVLLEANRAEITLGLLSKPDDPELLAQLKKTEAGIDQRRVETERLSGALVVAQSRDVKAEAEANKAAREAAVRVTRASMAESIKAAKEADKALDAFLAALLRVKASNAAISRGAYEAGVSGNTRHHMTSVATAGDVLAWRLMQAGLYDQLNSLIVHRPSIEGKMFAEIVEGNLQRLDSWIDHAMRGQEGN